jgi:acyl-CoA thioester hydrolase
MARIKLEMPENYMFSTHLKVRISDVNYGGHTGNDAILSFIHEARLQFFQSFGWSELDLGGVSTIMADVAIVYKNESFHADELEILVTPSDLNKYGFDLFYLIKNKKNGKEIANAKTGIVCFSYETHKIASLPDAVKALFETK